MRRFLNWTTLVRRLCEPRPILVVLLLALSLTVTAPRSYSQESESISLTVAQADSLIRVIDLQEIDLWEQRELARVDSLTFERRLALQQENYEAIIEQYRGARDNWFETALKHPVLWMAVGMWIGVNGR